MNIFKLIILLCLILFQSNDTIAQNETFITSDDPSIQYMGRIDFSNPKTPKFSFPGVTIRAKFQGTEIKAVLKAFTSGTNQTTNYFNVILDNVLLGKIAIESKDTLYPIVSGLTNKEHTIELVKRTESSVGTIVFKGFVIESTNLLSPSPLPEYKMEFIGDSWTCGYGNEISTNSPNTGFHSINEDNYRAWGYTISKKFNAQYHAIAISGRGLYRNNTGTTSGVIPDEFDKVIPGQTLQWNFINYIPDLVVIHLGTNDFYPETITPPQMLDSASYVTKYITFINAIRSSYGNTTKIICAFGSSKSDWWPENLKHLTRWRNYINAVVNYFHEKGDNLIYKFELSVQNAPYGEDWHPTITTHNQMANQITPFIESITGLNANNYEASLETLDIITSTLIQAEQSVIQIYPNPIVEKFTIEGILENQQWVIYDNKGVIQLSGMGSSGSAKNLKAGHYILKCGTTYKNLIKL